MSIIKPIDPKDEKPKYPQAPTPQIPISADNYPVDPMLEGVPAHLRSELSQDNPLPWQTYVPKEIDALAGDMLQRGEKFHYDQAMRGIPNNVKLSASNLSPTPQSEAIARKYERDVSNKLGSLRTQTEMQTPLKTSTGFGRSADIYGKQRAVQMQNFKEQYEFQNERLRQQKQKEAMIQAEKDAFFNNVLGGIPLVGGILAGGAKEGSK